MKQLPRALRTVVLPVCLSGLLVLAAVLLCSDPGLLTARVKINLLLAALIFLGELHPIVIARGDSEDEVTSSTTFTLALTLLGPLALALLAQGLSVAVGDLRSRKSPIKVFFNISQYMLTIAAARATFCVMAGKPFLATSSFDVPDDVLAALVAGAVFFAVNNALAGLVTAVALDRPVLEHLRSDIRFQLATSGVLLSFAPVVAVSLKMSLWLAPLLLFPILAIHKSARLAADRENEALHDSLTELPNRALFRLRAMRALDACDRSGEVIAVLLIDLDHFKEINDTLGHHVGDKLIVEVGKRLRNGIRPGDTVARLGGDEFAVLSPIHRPKDAAELGWRLLESLRDTFTVEGVRLDVQASIGVAVSPEHGQDVDTLVQRADIALYAAKVDRGSVSVYEANADVHTVERLALAGELREALEKGQLFLEYQPQVDARTGAVTGFEALVRWRHPHHGILYPDDFLPVAENTGLIAPMTMVILEQALAEVSRWREAGHDLTVAVNLSARHLTDLDLPAATGRLLRKARLPGSALVLEVTETIIMADPIRAVAVLRGFRELGIALAVDDFGTGYSSLAYLQRLEVDELKIDKSFVLPLAHSPGDAVIVRSTIELAHNLGLRVVAEGVESPETMRMLQSWDCDTIQGYLMSRPLGCSAVLPWLDARVWIPAPRQSSVTVLKRSSEAC